MAAPVLAPEDVIGRFGFHPDHIGRRRRWWILSEAEADRWGYPAGALVVETVEESEGRVDPRAVARPNFLDTVRRAAWRYYVFAPLPPDRPAPVTLVQAAAEIDRLETINAALRAALEEVRAVMADQPPDNKLLQRVDAALRFRGTSRDQVNVALHLAYRALTEGLRHVTLDTHGAEMRVAAKRAIRRALWDWGYPPERGMSSAEE
ncbi:MAG: hypothetical protein DIU79_14770 [Actinobacteria bacterium]|nr:MAG: hypothetical protein DIU79_14770 [Actinomycetota bacterium]